MIDSWTDQLDKGWVERVQIHGKRQLHLHVAVRVVLSELAQVLAQRARVAHAVYLNLPHKRVKARNTPSTEGGESQGGFKYGRRYDWDRGNPERGAVQVPRFGQKAYNSSIVNKKLLCEAERKKNRAYVVYGTLSADQRRPINYRWYDIVPGYY